MQNDYCNRNCSNYKCRKNKNQEEKTNFDFVGVYTNCPEYIPTKNEMLKNILEFFWFYNRNATNEELKEFKKEINKFFDGKIIDTHPTESEEENE